MQLIMENWRHFISEDKNQLILKEEQEWKQIKDVYSNIGMALKVLQTKEAGVDAGAALTKAGFRWLWSAAKTIPVVGNIISGIDFGSDTVNLLQTAVEITQAMANAYSSLDDDQIDADNPLTKLFNVRDETAKFFKKEVINAFSKAFLEFIRENPDTHINVDTFATDAFTNWLQASQGLEVKPKYS